MIAVPRQLVLDLAHRQALGAEDFLVSRSNSEAVELIDRWPDWPHPASVVIGTQGSGKTHLAHVWQLRSSAGLVAASATTDAAVCSFWFSNYQLDSTQAIAWEPISCNIASLVELCATCTIDCQKSWNSADKYWNVKYTINQ